MKIKNLFDFTIVLVLTGLIVSACGAAQPAPATALPSPVPVMFTETPRPSETPAPVSTAAPTMAPTEMARLSPSPQSFVSIAYDSESKKIILFGGLTGKIGAASGINSETWAFDPITSHWTLMKPVKAPQDRAGVDMAYDSESDRIILYGGFNISQPISDTWAYNYNSNIWEKMSNGPVQHLGARLAYDSESDRVILFGGYKMDQGPCFNETWAYDFNSDTWKNMDPKTSPAGRNYQGITYDSSADRVLTWGGLDDDKNPVDLSLWAYDFNKNTWTELKTAEGSGPGPRDFAALSYDTESNYTILYGGTSGSDETWSYEYKTNKWIKLDLDPIPGHLAGHDLTYCPDVDRIILFGGGEDPFSGPFSGETWKFDFNSNNWTKVVVQE